MKVLFHIRYDTFDLHQVSESLPDINNALTVEREDGSKLVIEVALELGDGVMTEETDLTTLDIRS